MEACKKFVIVDDDQQNGHITAKYIDN